MYFIRRLPDLKLGNLRSSDDSWTTLAGQLIKAASTRHYVPFLRSLLDELFPAPVPIEKAMRRAVSSLNRFYEIIYQAGMFLNAAELAELDLEAYRLRKYWMLLRHLSELDGKLQWQIPPKGHCFCHLQKQCSLINRRYLAN